MPISDQTKRLFEKKDIDLLETHIEHLSDMINDLTLSLGMWIEGYPFDEDHKTKQKLMINNACFLIGKPRTIEELKEMMGYKE